MAKSQRLTLAHVRSVFRLVGEVAEFGADWRHHMLTGLLRLTGSQVAMGGDALILETGFLAIPDALDIGWATASDRRVYLDFMSTGLCHREPTVQPTLADPAAAWTQSRRQLISDRAYYRSEGYYARREGHNGDYLHSCQPRPESGTICMFQLNRALGEPPFTSVELKLANLFHGELAHDRVDRRRRQRESLYAGLPPRPRQVLDLLLSGRSEKMIAHALRISPHTVHQYVKLVYSHLGVHSRTEFVALILRP